MNPPNGQEIKQTVGYLAAYRRKDGKIGYVDRDRDSGYLTFTTYMPKAESAAAAKNQVHSIFHGMRTYYGHEQVDFDTVQVVELSIQTADELVVNEAMQTALLERARSTFSQTELEVLRTALIEKKL